MSTLTIKYIIVGNSSVGKSCLLLRYTEDKYEPMHDITIGVEFGTKTVYVDNNTIKIQIWDTAGQESFKSIISSYFRGALGALLVFDLTNKESFNSIKEWMNMVKNKCNTPISFLLVGNKADLENERVITKKEALEFAKNNDMEYIETSTKTGYNVNIAFNNLNNIIFKKIKNNLIEPMYYQTYGKLKLENISINNYNNNNNNKNNDFCGC
jgi:Ras-related protein Rab-2A